MSVRPDDVLHLAGLARLPVPAERLPHLVEELNGILSHMESLMVVPVDSITPMSSVADAGPPERADVADSDSLRHPLPEVAPAWRDGFFLVPRLAAHEDA